MNISNPPQPIHIGNLLYKIDNELISLLRGLSTADWSKQTIAPKWKVKDVAVHLLDGNLRTLSMLRDGFYGEKTNDIHSYRDLVSYLNQLNADWVKAMKRLSPTVIIDLLETSGKEYCDFIQSLPPYDIAEFSVGWAGEKASKNWFHVAREYTEKWHHQQQIRHAVGALPALLEDEYFIPYLETSIRALPYHYRDIKGSNGDLIKFTFKGMTDKVWFLKYAAKWELYSALEKVPTCEVIIPDDIAWKIFTKGIDHQTALDNSNIKGDYIIGKRIFEMVAVMA